MKKGKPELSDPELLEELSEETREAFRKSKVNLKNRRVKKYVRDIPKHKMFFLSGYDLMQYNIVVRPYVLRKFSIKNDTELDILLYLFPIQYFTKADFNILPVYNRNYNVKILVERGYLELAIPGQKQYNGKKVYTLTDLAVRIVQEYYQYLSGEKTVSNKNYKSPFKTAENTKIDQKRDALMERLKHDFSTWRRLFNDEIY